MERESNVHSPRVDDTLAHEVESSTRGAPVEARAEPFRAMEDPGDGEPVPEAVLHEAASRTDPTPLDREEVRARSELTMHLLPSRFPTDRAGLVACAGELDAPDALLTALGSLPAGRYENVEQVWEALGGRREVRTRPEPAEPQPRSFGASTAPAMREFEFAFDLPHRLAGLPFGIRPETARLTVDERPEPPVLRIVFGPWSVATPLANVTATELTGPYSLVKTAGPAHLSLVDRD